MASYCEKPRLRGAIHLLPNIILAGLFFNIMLSLRLLLSHLPTSHLTHHDHEPITKALVVASTTRDDTSWLSQIPPSLNWTLYHYCVDKPIAPDFLTVPSTKGNEAMVYLTYIIDHYDDLPQVIFFHHAHLTAWHQRWSSLLEVTRLRAEHILRAGYASARCLSGRENIVTLEGGQPADLLDASPRFNRRTRLVTLLDAFLEPEKGETDIPSRISAPCCAQFAVSRDAVRRRSNEWWETLREWVLQTPLESAQSGRLMEMLWHIWFGMPAEL